jgi:hypothetical protein
MDRRSAIPAIVLVILWMSGCAGSSHITPRLVTAPPDFYRAAGLHSPTSVAAVLARCTPPLGWTAQPLKSSERHTHQVWLSSTGKTAYGVIHFKLPLPVGVNIVHWEFLREMKKREGEATELSQRGDPALPGLRFICEGGKYKMRVNLIVDGYDGWAIYAGTLRAFDVIPEELELAERARENTILGLPEKGDSTAGE